MRRRDRGVQPGDERLPPRGPGHAEGPEAPQGRGPQGRLPDPDGGAPSQLRGARIAIKPNLGYDVTLAGYWVPAEPNGGGSLHAGGPDEARLFMPWADRL